MRPHPRTLLLFGLGYTGAAICALAAARVPVLPLATFDRPMRGVAQAERIPLLD